MNISDKFRALQLLKLLQLKFPSFNDCCLNKLFGYSLYMGSSTNLIKLTVSVVEGKYASFAEFEEEVRNPFLEHLCFFRMWVDYGIAYQALDFINVHLSLELSPWFLHARCVLQEVQYASEEHVFAQLKYSPSTYGRQYTECWRLVMNRLETHQYLEFATLKKDLVSAATGYLECLGKRANVHVKHMAEQWLIMFRIKRSRSRQPSARWFETVYIPSHAGVTWEPVDTPEAFNKRFKAWKPRDVPKTKQKLRALEAARLRESQAEELLLECEENPEYAEWLCTNSLAVRDWDCLTRQAFRGEQPKLRAEFEEDFVKFWDQHVEIDDETEARKAHGEFDRFQTLAFRWYQETNPSGKFNLDDAVTSYKSHLAKLEDERNGESQEFHVWREKQGFAPGFKGAIVAFNLFRGRTQNLCTLDGSAY
jgi:hypothetical protein